MYKKDTVVKWRGQLERMMSEVLGKKMEAEEKRTPSWDKGTINLSLV